MDLSAKEKSIEHWMKCIEKYYSFLRRSIQNWKKSYGKDWYSALPWILHNTLYSYPMYFIIREFSFYKYKNIDLRPVSICFCQQIHFIHGFYFDPSVYKKGTNIEMKLNGIVWNMKLNNDDGFYVNCFGEFNIFPLCSMTTSPLVITCDNFEQDQKSFNIIGFNFNNDFTFDNPFFDSSLTSSLSSLSFCDCEPKIKFKHCEVGHRRWPFLDWAANRIKKALRLWVVMRKEERRKYQQAMLELRAIPEIGVDYFEKLENWPKN